VLGARPVAKPGHEHALDLVRRRVRMPSSELLALDRLAELEQREGVAEACGGARGGRVWGGRLRLTHDEAGRST